MRKIGWIYLVLYGCDAVFTGIATLDPAYGAFNNVFSTVVVVSSISVLILSVKNRLHPKWLFQLLSIYYLIISFVVPFALGVLLVQKVGVENIPADATEEFFYSHFPWYWTFHWGIVVSIFVLALIGFRVLKSAEENAAQAVQAVPWDARLNQGVVEQGRKEVSLGSHDHEEPDDAGEGHGVNVTAITVSFFVAGVIAVLMYFSSGDLYDMFFVFLFTFAGLMARIYIARRKGRRSARLDAEEMESKGEGG